MQASFAPTTRATIPSESRHAEEMKMTEDVAEAEAWPRLPPVQTGIRGLCPRCGKGRLFAGFLKLAPGCEVCGLSYDFADPADGPAFFVITFGCVPAAAASAARRSTTDRW